MDNTAQRSRNEIGTKNIIRVVWHKVHHQINGAIHLKCTHNKLLVLGDDNSANEPLGLQVGNNQVKIDLTSNFNLIYFSVGGRRNTVSWITHIPNHHNTVPYSTHMLCIDPDGLRLVLFLKKTNYQL